jgi:hypothetical protein
MSQELQRIEPQESESVVPYHPMPPPSLFGTADPVEVVARASRVAESLKQVIKAQGLISKISGKEYPRCEAWTLLGTMLGVFPVLVWTRPVEGGWEARVEAKTRDGAVVGAAEAQCLKSERNWSNRDDFALRSMAQTRATAKALRMPLGFVMTLGGFQATPAEEMDFEQKPDNANVPRGKPAQPPPKPTAKPQTPAQATSKTRAWFLGEMRKLFSDQVLVQWLMDDGPPYMLGPDQDIDKDLPLEHVPTTKEALKAKVERCAKFMGVPPEPQPSAAAPQDDGDLGPQKGKPAPKIESAHHSEPWHQFPMLWGKNKGTPLGELDKKYLFGLWCNYEVEREYQGKPKKQETIERDEEFREMLDRAGEHYEFEEPDSRD